MSCAIELVAGDKTLACVDVQCISILLCIGKDCVVGPIKRLLDMHESPCTILKPSFNYNCIYGCCEPNNPVHNL